MQKTDTFYTFVLGGGAASAAFLLGGIDHLVVALAIFMAIDFVTGLFAGTRKTGTSSKRAFRGIVKKGAMIGLVIVAHQLDIIAGTTDAQFLRNSMILFLIAVEGISIIENMERLGVPIPSFLYKHFEQMKDENGKGEK
ncbi:toxin secretion/phage lysis holin [Caldalkalibacillus uzonensis]|uniref:Toxin secretion/phage lysis holin n=1 Tax=Caldalkalibacillus uzonensis TaxID=353224 RepID=A0ABU0CWP3_9BACI|nr:phage holin family protein [Caldalkalibacillus uzonensis]MDQ0340279.1 toxin secretion/phage lysis holin [Caldalkalibacillus uzonensis]